MLSFTTSTYHKVTSQACSRLNGVWFNGVADCYTRFVSEQKNAFAPADSPTIINLLAQRATPPIFPPYDLLSAILAEADKSTCVKAAVVCRSWYEPALNELWRVVTNARDILEVLAPMEEKYIRYRRRNPIYDLVISSR